MSRQSKMARKRAVARQIKADGGGPAKTTPSHGKTNRLPYDASIRKSLSKKVD